MIGHLLLLAFAPQQAMTVRAQALADEFVENSRIAGISIAAIQDGEVKFALGSGFANVQAKTPVSPTTLMRLGSVSKPLTAIAALKLVEAGKLDLDKPITTYVPEWPKDKAPLTLRQLLTHTSGVRHYKAGVDPTGATFETYSSAESIGLFAKDDLLYPPGSNQTYSTHAFTIIARAIETASGKDFTGYLRSQIFKSKTSELDCEVAKDLKTARSDLYATLGTALTKFARREDLSWKYGGGGMEATASGLARWGDRLRSGQIVKPTTRDLAWTVATLRVDNKQSYGLGWRVVGDVVSHGGAQQGCRSHFMIDRKKKLTIVVLTNTSGTHAPAQLADRLAALFP